MFGSGHPLPKLERLARAKRDPPDAGNSRYDDFQELFDAIESVRFFLFESSDDACDIAAVPRQKIASIWALQFLYGLGIQIVKSHRCQGLERLLEFLKTAGYYKVQPVVNRLRRIGQARVQHIVPPEEIGRRPIVRRAESEFLVFDDKSSPSFGSDFESIGYLPERRQSKLELDRKVAGMSSASAANGVKATACLYRMVECGLKAIAYKSESVEEVALSGSVSAYEKCQWKERDVTLADTLAVLYPNTAKKGLWCLGVCFVSREGRHGRVLTGVFFQARVSWTVLRARCNHVGPAPSSLESQESYEMSSPQRILNFSAGPAMLPEPVLEEARSDLWSLGETGVGILEHSHRGGAFTQVIDEAEADCRSLAGLDDDYAVLFLQGGATLQFAQVPMSFLGDGAKADYLNTGVWTKKAIANAGLFGDIHLAFDGAASAFDHVPSASELDGRADATYTWYCSNNTIAGTQYAQPPAVSTPLVCDASSDIFSRPLPLTNHAMVIAGAQKNLGGAGCTLVISRRDFLDRVRDGLPPMLDYRQHAAKGSCLNTPPTFAIYVMGRVFKWLKGQGGLEAMARINTAKAAAIYDAIDTSGGFYRAVARPGSRSQMNITFRTPNNELDKTFIAEALVQGMSGLKGHRSVGGLRASIYNAFPASGCATLASLMGDFASRNG